jgi:hypothetical protein
MVRSKRFFFLIRIGMCMGIDESILARMAVNFPDMVRRIILLIVSTNLIGAWSMLNSIQWFYSQQQGFEVLEKDNVQEILYL